MCPSDADGYVYTSFEKAGVTPGYFMSVNFHGVSEQDSRGPVGCVRFWYLLQGDCKMHLKLSQAYLNSPTQLFYDPETMYELWDNDTNTGQWTHVEVSLYVTRAFKVRLDELVQGFLKDVYLQRLFIVNEMIITYVQLETFVGWTDRRSLATLQQ
jgi:hypothetical protein